MILYIFCAEHAFIEKQKPILYIKVMNDILNVEIINTPNFNLRIRFFNNKLFFNFCTFEFIQPGSLKICIEFALPSPVDAYKCVKHVNKYQTKTI